MMQIRMLYVNFAMTHYPTHDEATQLMCASVSVVGLSRLKRAGRRSRINACRSTSR